jgi:poly-gamma-glutamate capsule biosynthesis protein CapA/YwtB (metallophosphatase superfamily)
MKSNTFGKSAMISPLFFRFPAFLLLFGISSLAWGEPVVITAVGDIMPTGEVVRTFTPQGFDRPYSGTASELRRGDICVGNLESPLTRGGKEFMGKKFRFRARPETAAALKRAGFSVLTLANNHTMDFGGEGLTDTLRALEDAKLLHAGAGANLAQARQEAVVTARGKRVAFLAYSLTYPEEFYAGVGRPGTAQGNMSWASEDIARARKNAEYVVVSFHWGEELAQFPKPYQRRAAHAAIDAGADLILGHHPHVLQGIEQYRGKSILYSLGNFVFGSNSSSADVSIIARISLDGAAQRVEVIPLNVLNSQVRFRPTLLSGRRGEEVVDRLNSLSAPFNSRITMAGGRYTLEGSAAPEMIAFSQVDAMTPRNPGQRISSPCTGCHYQ